MEPWTFFDSWNNKYPSVFVPSDIYSYKKLPSKDSKYLEVDFFDGENEHDIMIDERNILLGRNFTDKALNKCTKFEDAKDVVNNLIRTLGDIPYLAIEIRSGCTGMTLELLSRDKFGSVITYAIDEASLIMLRRNINLYALGSKSITAGEYNGSSIKKQLMGCVVFIHNPIVIDKNMYIDDNADITVSDFLAINKSYVFTFVIQSKDLIKESGWDSRWESGYTILVNNNPTILHIPNKGGLLHITDANTKSLITSKIPVPPYTSSIFDNEVKTYDIEQSDVGGDFHSMIEDLPDGLWKTIIKEIPRPSEHKKGGPEWIKDLQNMLKKFHTLLAGDDQELFDMIDGIISMENIKKYWMISLIHESASAERNYEQLETFGDKYLESSFFTYVVERYPGITSSEIDSFKMSYLSFEWQPLFAKNLGLDGWIISNATPEMKMFEDVFESFSGAIYFASENVKRGMGSVMLLRMVTALFDHVNLYSNGDIHLGNKKMVIHQYKEQIGNTFELISDQQYTSGSQYVYKTRFTPEALKFFTSRGIITKKLEGMIIVAKEATRHEAELQSRNQVYFALKDVGVTLGWIKEYNKSKKIAMNPKVEELYNECRVKAIRAGYIELQIKKYDNASTYRGASLVGFTKDGKKKNLTYQEIQVNPALPLSVKDGSLYISLLQKYLDKK